MQQYKKYRKYTWCKKVQLEEALLCTFSEAKTGKVIEYVVKGRWYEQCTRLGDTDDGAVTSKRLCHSVRRSSC
jgi:hypothetical protein